MKKSRVLSFPAVVVALLLGVSLPAAAQAHATSDEQAIAGYTLSMEKLTAFRDATADMVRVARSNPDLASRFDRDEDEDDGDKSLDQLAARIDSEPTLKAALAAHGLTGREYTLLQLSLMQALLAETLLSQQPQASLPAGVNPKNVAFVKAHQAELRQLLASVGDEGQ